ncbi:TRAP transporter substrate-binding protein [Aromatoleum buckelii]|uniref:TRAP transporter substrate-binding protein n=1 Tax=Aromatoleum buckelii TaxID=200254 RepID=UPI001B7CF609|nr:TRAP transporter substrate-binding protein [Aromatoleum buckelii]
MELRFAHWLPAQHALVKTGFAPWAKSVEAASGGSIKVMLFPAQQLGKAADHYDIARDGIADMSWVSPGYQVGRFPIFAASELPFMASAPGAGSAALDAWYRKYAAKEMADVKLCFAHMHIGTLHSKAPITDPDQIRGMKIRPANGTVAQMVTLLGGSNVQVSAPESRDALDKGVADAITFPWNSLITFNVHKAAKFHTDMRLYNASFVWVMNKGWYDQLSTAQRKVIDDHCNNEWAAKVGTAWGDEEDSGAAKLAEMGGGQTIVKLTPAQLDKWKKAVMPVYDMWAKATPAGSADPVEVLDEYRRELNARNAAY